MQGHVTQTYVDNRKVTFLIVNKASPPADFCGMCTEFHAAARLHLSCVQHWLLKSQFGRSSAGSNVDVCVCVFVFAGSCRVASLPGGMRPGTLQQLLW